MTVWMWRRAARPAYRRCKRRPWNKLVAARPDVTLTAQRLHFKKLLRVKTEQGKELALRFYDPQVLNVYLPTCTTEEFQTLVGPLSQLMAEIDDGHAMRVFELDGDSVRGRDTVLSIAPILQKTPSHQVTR